MRALPCSQQFRPRWVPHSIARWTRCGVLIAAAALFVSVTARGADYSASGSYQGGRQKVSVPRPDGSSFEAWMYYPAQRNGLDAPPDVSGGNYPIVTFGHPFVLGPLFNNSTLRHLASWGYVTIAPTTQGGFLPNHAAFAADLRYGIDYVQSLDSNPSSPFYGKLATDAVGASGFSMGGGASILATAADPRIKAVANFAAAETFPVSAIDAMQDIQVPVRLIAGSIDRIAPVALQQQPMYDQGNSPVQLRSIVGGNHLFFQDFPLSDPLAISQVEQLALSRSELTAFFELYLKQDQTAWNQVWGPEAADDPAFQSQLNPGIEVDQLSTTPGDTLGSIVHRLSVTNIGLGPDSYDLFVEGHQFESTLSMLQTPILAPGESAAFELFVDASAGGLGASDQALVSARSKHDGGTRGYSIVTTTGTSLAGAALTAHSVPEPAGWLLAIAGGVSLWIGTQLRRRTALGH